MGVTYRNVAAEQCTYAGTAGGRHVVRFRGSDYTIIGLFFRLRPDGRRALWYVLRSARHPRDGLRMWEAALERITLNGQAERGAARRIAMAGGDVGAGGSVPA